MIMRFCFAVAAGVLFSMCVPTSWGQEEQSKLPVQKEETEPPDVNTIGGFRTEGSVTTGYRFTTIKGNGREYKNLFDLNQGFRVMDMNLIGRAQEGANLLADSYSVTANGLGGDSYRGGQLTLRKHKLYDLRVNYRQSYYYWDRNDSALLPLGPSGIANGLTSNHDWATVRRLGSMHLNVRATNQLQFSVEYDRNSRDGMTQTTRSLHYEGNPNSSWGGFARANPYLMTAPLDALANRITGGIDYSLRGWTVRYRAGYQSFSQNSTWNNLESPDQSINVDDARTSRELLTRASWGEFRRLTTPISEFSYNGIVNRWLELRGSYSYYNYSGPDNIDASFIGNARTGSTEVPYSVSLSSRARVEEPIHDVRQGLTAKVKDWWRVYADYRYYRVASDSAHEFGSVYDGIAADPLGEDQEWRIGTHLVDLSTEFVPLSSLVVRTGIRYTKRDVMESAEGLVNPTATARTKSVWPTVSVAYKPVKIFSVRGDFQSNTSTNPYTSVNAKTDVGSRFVFRLQPTENISIEDNLVIRNRTYLQTEYRNQYRSNAISIFYQFRPGLSVNAGYSYESLFGTDAVNFIRGAQPRSVIWQDAFINRGWRGGIAIKPTRRFGINLSGNFLRTTGTSQISGEPPITGPLTFPLITGTLYYDFPKLGMFSVDLQRAYYAEEIVTGNNFGASLLTIRWTKNIGRETE